MTVRELRNALYNLNDELDVWVDTITQRADGVTTGAGEPHEILGVQPPEDTEPGYIVLLREG